MRTTMREGDFSIIVQTMLAMLPYVFPVVRRLLCWQFRNADVSHWEQQGGLHVQLIV